MPPMAVAQDFKITFDKVHGKTLGSEVDPYFKCILCKGVVIDPVECISCSTAFCTKCINTYLRSHIPGPLQNNNPCPSCKGNWQPITIHKALKTQLDSL
mmetsp:Transcript_24473/g.24059  ORF Transcript_24473/g.24059 Transcript_24473/m.24059 type:complete len:99 (+) Transcript_24473:105-401(+)